MIMMIVSIPNQKIGEMISADLLENRIAGCVQISSPIKSQYIWQDKIETAEERLLFIKLPKNNRQIAENTICRIHPYDLPEIISIDISSNKQYKTWLSNVTKQC